MKNDYGRISGYRVMWVLVFFDLPVDTKKARKAAVDFRNKLMKDGFTMFQFSIYIRHCQSAEAADAHVRRVKSILPEYGQVGILAITDKQFGSMEIYMERKPNKPPVDDFPLELFRKRYSTQKRNKSDAVHRIFISRKPPVNL